MNQVLLQNTFHILHATCNVLQQIDENKNTSHTSKTNHFIFHLVPLPYLTPSFSTLNIAFAKIQEDLAPSLPLHADVLTAMSEAGIGGVW